ncbi:MAG TPA: gas vesicle protein GvpN [Methanosarcinales archaeon]|nr:gas vesicle protein GvpN [Methanosarcinales archaeon]
MQYVSTHPRKVRGEEVHQTSSEKKRTAKNRQLHKSMSIGGLEHEVSGASFHKGIETEECEVAVGKHPKLFREAVEAAYIVPDADHFVDAPDVKEVADRLKLWLSVGYPVHLIGPTGCGKTSMAMHIAKELGQPVVWINGDEAVTTTDLIGGYSQIEQETLRDKYVHNVFRSKDILKADWVDNPLTLACKYGYTLVYNEFSRTKPLANNILLSVFEEGILELPTKFGEERYIRVHPDFNAILTSNSVEYAGVHKPQDALLDRLVGIYMDYYSFNTEVKIVRAHTGVPERDARKIVGVVGSLREKLSDAQKPGTRACIMIGQGLKALNGHGSVNFEQLCIDVMATKTSSPADLLEKQSLVKEAIAGFA